LARTSSGSSTGGNFGMSPRRDTGVAHHDLRGFGSGAAPAPSTSGSDGDVSDAGRGRGGRSAGSAVADEIDALLDDDAWEDVRSGKAGRRGGSAERVRASTAATAGVTKAASGGGGGGIAPVGATSGSRANVSGSSKLDAESFLSSLGDLNRVGDASLRAAKAKMDVVFDANRLKPGDPGYVYDVRVDFSPPTATSEWDE
jgi:hypothetical protein